MADQFVVQEQQRLVNENVLMFEVSKKRAKKRVELAVARLRDNFVSEQVKLGSHEGKRCRPLIAS